MFDFLSIRKTVDSVREQYMKLQTELNRVQSEILSTRCAAPHRQEWHDAAKSWVDESAAKFAPAVSARITNKYTTGPSSAFKLGSFGITTRESGDANPGHMDALMCAIFGSQIKKAIFDVIEKMPWENEGLPPIERAAKLEKLRAEEKEILTRRADLVKSAETAGIEI